MTFETQILGCLSCAKPYHRCPEGQLVQRVHCEDFEHYSHWRKIQIDDLDKAERRTQIAIGASALSFAAVGLAVLEHMHF